MLSFEDCRLLVTVLHYTLFVSLGLFLSFYKVSGYVQGVFRFYLVVFCWAVVCLIFDGCPVTHLENRYACMVYGEEFYPRYNFGMSNVRVLLGWGAFYIPLGVVLLQRVLLKLFVYGQD